MKRQDWRGAIAVALAGAMMLAGCTRPPAPSPSTADQIEIEGAETAETAEAADAAPGSQNGAAAYQAGDGEPAAISQTPDGPPPELAFFDSYAFDVDLSSALRDGHGVLPVNTSFDLNNIPDRMDTWFARIIKEGGRVRAKPVAKEGEMQQTRGLISALIDIFIAASEAAEREVLYGPVDEYDALLHFDEATGRVAFVEFVKR